MNVQDIKRNYICKGDYIGDGGEFSMIKDFEIYDDKDATVVLVGGGVMSIQEISEDMVYLESEIF